MAKQPQSFEELKKEIEAHSNKVDELHRQDLKSLDLFENSIVKLEEKVVTLQKRMKELEPKINGKP